jgi:oxygen-independent coproporphyrinogen III oxidase
MHAPQMEPSPRLDPAAVLRRAERLPRYTSYPTANHFSPTVTAQDYAGWLERLPGDVALSLYLHVPYCDALCWYCACSTKATRRYAPVSAYLERLLTEITDVAARVPAGHSVRHLHWGGGSPDILDAGDIRRLGSALASAFRFAADLEFAIEVDPRLMTEGKTDSLVEVGVNRISVGVQDFDPQVQRAIGRIQSFAVTRDAIGMFRARGVRSINMDLVYGLPHQTEATLMQTLEQALELMPDRIALFGYAHLPQRAHNQRLIDERALPDAPARYSMSQRLARALQRAGYTQRGIDHFARSADRLATAPLNRNFQGYTTDAAEHLIGFGASAIGKLPQGYVQNAVGAREYMAAIDRGELATARGLTLTDDDRLRGFVIERLMCDFAVSAGAVRDLFGARAADQVLREAEAVLAEDTDGLVERTADGLGMTEAGRPFVRSICARFDAWLKPEPGVVRHAMAV